VRDATVRLVQNEGVLHLRIEDQGVGFDAHAVMAASNSNGLTGMRQRVALLNGDFEIRSAGEAGTALIIQLPLDQDLGAR
jgi:signal transduction histidine kinase